tara:strand:+ start:224 stop:436 length:213 start_codon:yes stop_codon:yes gene_type:complete
MTYKEIIKNEIDLSMFKNEITKIELAEHLNVSYPTMLSKLKDVGSLKLSEFNKVCEYLNLNINDLIKNVW